MTPSPDDFLSAVLEAALERATDGPFNPDGTLTDGARTDVQAIIDQADEPEGRTGG
jgi:hypothetical protein